MRRNWRGFCGKMARTLAVSTGPKMKTTITKRILKLETRSGAHRNRGVSTHSRAGGERKPLTNMNILIKRLQRLEQKCLERQEQRNADVKSGEDRLVRGAYAGLTDAELELLSA